MKLKPLKPLAPGERAAMPSWIPMDEIRPYLDEYRGALAAGAVVAAVLLVFGLLYVRHTHTVAERSSQIFREAINVYNYRIPPPDGETVPAFASDDEKYSRALQAFQSLSETYPSADLAPVALFYVGNCRYRLKQYTQALDAFEQFLTRYRRHSLAPSATLGKGDCLEQLARFQEAYTAYKSVMDGAGPLAYEGAIGTARCLLKLTETDRNRWSEAADILHRLSADTTGYGGKTSRELQKLLSDLSTAAPRPAAGGAAPRPSAQPPTKGGTAGGAAPRAASPAKPASPAAAPTAAASGPAPAPAAGQPAVGTAAPH